MLRVGVELDEFGRPTRPILRDAGPARGAIEGGSFHGSRVVGEHGAVERGRKSSNDARDRKRDRPA